jgi:hypothetical protein
MSTIARLTLAQYDEMIRGGVFDRGPREHVEFIRGEIREMSPIGSRHEVLVDWLKIGRARRTHPWGDSGNESNRFETRRDSGPAD